MDKVKQILKSLIRIKLIAIIIVIITILIVFLSAITYFITIDDGTYDEDDWESTPYVASTYTSQVSISSNGLQTVTSANDLWDEMISKGNNIENYLDSAEELEKLMNAEIITQYPKMDSGDLNGIIEFERYKDDGTSQMLKFVDYDTFNSYIDSQNTNVLNYFTLNDNNEVLIAVINKKTEELTTNDEDIIISDYTSALTESNKISDNTYKKEEYTITTQKINYKNYVEKYTMPFQYLWALLVVTEDKDFVLELADLVEDSKIVISIYDNITTTVNKNTYTYKKEQRTDTYVRVSAENNYEVEDYPSERYWLSEQSPEASEHYDSNYQADYEIQEEQYQVTHTITEETNTTIVDIIEADTWIAEYSRTYNYQSSQTESDESNTVTLNDSDYKENSGSPEDSDENQDLLNDAHALELAQEAKEYIEQNKSSDTSEDENIESSISEDEDITSSIIGAGIIGIIRPDEEDEDDEEVKVNVEYVQKRYYKHNIEVTQENIKTTSYQKYIAQPAEEKIKDEKGENQVNFVTILCSKEHKNAKSTILEIDDWLFEILEINEDTKNMVDLTKYLLQKVLEKDYGVSDFDFSTYDPSSFSTSTSSGTDISLITTSLTKEEFVNALTNYSNNGASGNKEYFDTNFLSRAEEIYTLSKKYVINPELVITIALKESGYNDNGTNNFWGLDTPNGSSLHSYSSFEEGIKRLAEIYSTYMPGGSMASTIENRAAERQAANCNEDGYGDPGTLKGMLSVYSDLCGSNTKHREGDSGDGGNYYLKIIYGSEFYEKCGNVHEIGVDDYTIQEKADYTAWLYKNQLAYWNLIFGSE